MIKGVLIDYGGTIDTNGRHWAHVLWEAYQQASVPVSQERFMEAYSFGERALAMHPIVKPFHTFLEVLRLKVEQQFDFLGIRVSDSEKIEEVARYCMDLVVQTVRKATPVLEAMSARYPMVLVSNFYGNIQAVLEDLGIRKYFKDIVESAVVGVRKPDPKIYALGVARIGLLASECVVIGDSFKKDIIPGKSVGCKTIWINVEGFGEDLLGAEQGGADLQINDFAYVSESIERLNH